MSSPYAAFFHDGATIYPRSFYFIRLRDHTGQLEPDRIYWAETDLEQAEDAKPPYKDVRINGRVEGQFLYPVALAKHVLPFAFLKPSLTVLPVLQSEGALKLYYPDRLKAEGYREIGRWMERVERIWRVKRKGKATQKATEWIDYQGKLTVQSNRSPHLVLYNASGTDLAATSVYSPGTQRPLIIDHKLYWAACESRQEADYLAAILNSREINEAIKPFQSMGLLGERDIHKKVLDLPIPAFDRRKPRHRELALLGAQACAEAARLISTTPLPASLARQRAFMRQALAPILNVIDEITRMLL